MEPIEHRTADARSGLTWPGAPRMMAAHVFPAAAAHTGAGSITNRGAISMQRSPTEASPQVYARIGGVLYLFIIVAGLFGEVFVRDRLIVTGNSAGTADHVMASQLLWRAGIVG